ncbi:hypothetical protein PIB30_026182 [Stylosanthes scabra]|uniref:Uncharacterized protein n=1 Tax=Stylosanthes scabra TaxID=79078 RepID=A0ABU6XC28_9FABA|nr:hypothetical protein [Stylosanthes scabra]
MACDRAPVYIDGFVCTTHSNLILALVYTAKGGEAGNGVGEDNGGIGIGASFLASDYRDSGAYNRAESEPSEVPDDEASSHKILGCLREDFELAVISEEEEAAVRLALVSSEGGVGERRRSTQSENEKGARAVGSH